MAYFHGIRSIEKATDLIATMQTTAGLPVVVGRAPVHLTENPTANVNKPVLCYSWDEAVAALGYSEDWKNYELCETMFSEFLLYGVKPVVFINVLNPEVHKTAVTTKTYEVENNEVIINDGVLVDSLVIKENPLTSETAKKNVDYTAAYNENDQLVISIISGGSLDGKASIFIGYDKIDPSKVTYLDVIGGVNSSGGVKGLELVNMVYTMYGMVPGLILAPNWSQNPIVASVMKAKASTMGVFKCWALTDVDTTQARNYLEVNMWKNNNTYTGKQAVCWPCVKNEGKIFHISTQLAGVIGVMDAENEDIPYMSPSNRTMQATGLCLEDGTEVMLSLDQANVLNSQGIVTAINFSGGYKTWGNYTGAYPSTTDPKEAFICCRRMFDWLENTFILNYWDRVDIPLTARSIQSVVDSESIRLNGLVSRGFLVAASIEFMAEENPETDLIAGKFRLHRWITAPVPAQEIEDTIEYDAASYATMFEEFAG